MCIFLSPNLLRARQDRSIPSDPKVSLIPALARSVNQPPRAYAFVGRAASVRWRRNVLVHRQAKFVTL